MANLNVFLKISVMEGLLLFEVCFIIGLFSTFYVHNRDTLLCLKHFHGFWKGLCFFSVATRVLIFGALHFIQISPV